jgi:hypothetical protein
VKGLSTLRIRAEVEETINANYPDYTQIYTNGSKMEERVQCAVVTPGENKEIRLPRTFLIFNAEAKAINTAISITRYTIQPERVILIDSLSCLTVVDGMRKIYNPKVVRIMNQIHRKKEHLILMIQMKRPINTPKQHCKGKPTRTTKPLQKTGKTG